MRLKNGKTESTVLVATVMVVLKRLFESEALPDVLALYDLARHAHDQSYKVFSPKHLIDLKLLEDSGRMHQSIRNVVQSALSLDGDTVKMSSPIAA